MQDARHRPAAGRVRPHRRLSSRRPPFEAGAAATSIDRSDPDFALWVDQNVTPHKQPGYAIVNISLKPIGGIPGDAIGRPDRPDGRSRRTLQLRRAARHPRAEHRPAACPQGATSTRVWQALDDAGLADANLDLISDIIACPGLDYCSLANARSIPVAQKIAERFADPGAAARSGRAEAQDLAAASTPAATTMPATSASSASTGRARRTTSCCSAARARRTPASARSPAPASTRTASSTRSRRATDVYLAPARATASASSTPIAASASSRSRRRSMGDEPAPLPRRRSRTTSPPSRSTRSSTARPTPPPSASKRATTRARCSRISTASR